ncbi:MAG: hypothetical protein BGO41_03325 [Clostridiales bacterium 38-18]|nr:MAG: hypothetical protein BGO41_03325 [Clostridiales bacterium 38-18]
MLTLKNLLLNQDKQIYLFLNAGSKHDFIAKIMRWITHLGDTVTAILFALLALMLTPILNMPIGLLTISALLISQILVQSIKRIVNRPRPYKSISFSNVTQPPACQYSFPSGHTACAFTIALSYAFSIPSLTLIFMCIAFFVGLSRIVLGYHYPTDVLIGMLLAYLSHSITLLLLFP